MRAFKALFLAGWTIWASLGTALAGEARPLVVVELFTSQGCSSCPPADELIGQLARERRDVLPLALHVDYWDYIGWSDSFARPEHTARQKGYAHAAGLRSLYTPQMVVGGVDHVIGGKPMALAAAIAAHHGTAPRVLLSGRLRGNRAHLTAEPILGTTLPRRMEALLVRFIPRTEVTITRGENAGRRLRHANVVTAIETLGHWDGQARWTLDVVIEGDGAAAVLMQEVEDGPGPILAAIRLR